ncbi:hypothetical protein FQA39_LY10586 [Lamprigera yunnana]|nr:hypothetical protein FQA39_LY10586 [Lamprigera yunnana]
MPDRKRPVNSGDETVLLHLPFCYYFTATMVCVKDYFQRETLKRVLRKDSRAEREKCYSKLSARSSQVNSQSNTDSCSQQSSIRYLETEMRRLHDSRRPLVVAFRRKPTTQKIKQVTILDAELQKALDSLSRKSQIDKQKNPSKITRGVFRKSCSCTKSKVNALKSDYKIIELSSLQSHIHRNDSYETNWQNYSYIDANQLQLTNFKRSYMNLNACENGFVEVTRSIPKSYTMPNMEQECSYRFKKQ